MGNKKELIEIAKDHTTDINNDKFKEIYERLQKTTIVFW
jgi:hypothetical protein